MKKRIVLIFILLAVATFILASCSTSQINLQYSKEMHIGDIQSIVVSVSGPEHELDVAPWCESSDESIISVDRTGLTLTAVSAGTATITVHRGDLKKSVEITVCDRPSIPMQTDKPIIYLYPSSPTDITVRYVKKQNLITTYPKYTGEWRVHADTCGTLTDENGRQYYALFFDEKRTHDVDFSSGFYVTSDDAIPFLEEKLALLGFTEREADEFIMFWLPVLEKNGQSVVYFEQTDEREAECPLVISPSPDSTLRVIIHIKKVDAPVDIAPQTIVPFERRGFTLVEWGGTTY